MVARLPELDPQDCQAVLDTLSESQRARVNALLRELEGMPFENRTPLALDTKALPPGLSPWLLDRLGAAPEEGGVLAGKQDMTVHAMEALKACALELDPPPLSVRGSEPLRDTVKRIFGQVTSRLMATP